ncbi:MAG: T9SS type A sorting domain-containing protein, partial [candidate division Zixibacteria bacterium]|nr:T9SS type A sorting domain-containing protein [candidate division Zixibacteria bacterium]
FLTTPAASADTLDVSIRTNGWVLSAGETRMLGRIRLIAVAPVRGVETVVRIAHDEHFSVWDADGTKIDRTPTSGMVRIGKRGDVNLDGQFSIRDVILLVKRIASAPPEPSSIGFVLADANRDGRVDLGDVRRIVHLILRIPVEDTPPGKLSVVAPMRAYLCLEQNEINGATEAALFVEGQATFSGMETRMVFAPADLPVAAPQTTDILRDFVVDYGAEDRQIHIAGVSLSASGVALSGVGKLFSIPMTAKTERLPVLAEVALVDPQGRQIPVEIAAPVYFASVGVPDRFSLGDNVPNPFNPSTEIAYAIARSAHVTLAVYNLLGQEIVRLVDERQEAGRYRTVWDGRNGRGEPVASGVYLYRLVSGGHAKTRRMTLVK